MVSFKLKKIEKKVLDENSKKEYTKVFYLLENEDLGIKQFVNLPKGNKVAKDMYTKLLDKFVDKD